jgi:signal peptidase I
MAKRQSFPDRLVKITEAFLSWRKKVRRIKKEKRKKRNPIVDWIGAFFWAACMVLIANQYFLQAYVIPSGSMIDTLNINDRIFVNKFIYGPELLPGLLKLPGFIKPERNDIIIFENPSYISKGPVFDLVQRIIYMVTISLVDIDRDENGQPSAHFLIKRAVGMSGDRFIMEDGEMKVRFAGEDRWVEERDYAKERGWKHNINRMINREQYQSLEAEGRIRGWRNLGLSPPKHLLDASGSKVNPDHLLEKTRLETLRNARPYDRNYAKDYAKKTLGWYIPEGRIFPLGDNRDNSRDGRFFGPVSESRVLGRGSIIYWPPGRMGAIR